MKKVVRLTESDLERIIKKVISEQMASGVAFGNERNGFKMKREPKEQQTPQKQARKITSGVMVPTFQDLEMSAKKEFGELAGTLPSQTKTPTFTEFMKRGERFDPEQLRGLVDRAIEMARARERAMKMPYYQMSDYFTKMCNEGKAFCFSWTEGNEVEKNQALMSGQKEALAQVENVVIQMLQKLGGKNTVEDLKKYLYNQ